MNSRSRGFTLFELMMVLALAAVILGIGVPNFRDFQRNNRLTVAANDVLGMVITSRAEALAAADHHFDVPLRGSGGRRRHLRRWQRLDRIRRPGCQL